MSDIDLLARQQEPLVSGRVLGNTRNDPLSDPLQDPLEQSELTGNEESESVLPDPDEMIREDERVGIKERTNQALGDNQAVLKLLCEATEAEILELNQDEGLWGRALGCFRGKALDSVLDMLFSKSLDLRYRSSIFKQRHGIEIGSGGKRDALWFLIGYDPTLNKELEPEESFGTRGLDRIYQAFKKVPKTHLAKVERLMTKGSNKGSMPSGKSSNENPFIQVHYDEQLADMSDEEFMEANPEGSTITEQDDKKRNLNALDNAALHELGHQVDSGRKYSWSSGFMKLSGWQKFAIDGGGRKLMNELERALSPAYPEDFSKLERDLARRAAIYAVARQSGGVAVAHVEKIYKEDKLRLAGSTSRKRAYRSAEALHAAAVGAGVFAHLAVGREGASPWTKEPIATLSGDRQYHEGYPHDKCWWSYKNSARDNKLSAYQFRDPADDFAELYSAWYASNPPGLVVPPMQAKWFKGNKLDR
ncbi:MAG: hypothetical protein ABIO70_28665 [Pseudomonadota bacterium]